MPAAWTTLLEAYNPNLPIAGRVVIGGGTGGSVGGSVAIGGSIVMAGSTRMIATASVTPPGPPLIAVQPVNAAAASGAAASFTVLASSVSSMSFQWQKNFVNIPGATTNVLSFSNCAPSDQAIYRCLITNETGFKFTRSVLLTVSP
jgi:hypothetical protein